ncbi:MAG TPA: VOC family protein [Chryseolinea sp.]
MNDRSQQPRSAIIPTLYMKDLGAAIKFYKEAFDAEERWRIDYAGNVHVAEMSISSVLFRLHEEVKRDGVLSPSTLNATSIVIGLLVDNPDELAAKAIAAGATEMSPVQDFDYGYRQGTIRDPFGHHWCLERMDDFYKMPLLQEQQKN